MSRPREPAPPPAAVSLRADLWLWYTRFFKSRSVAHTAVEGGHVQVNGERVKASRALRPGDRLRITRERERFEVDVAGIPSRRGPATESRQYYVETPESEAARAATGCRLRPPRSARAPE